MSDGSTAKGAPRRAADSSDRVMRAIARAIRRREFVPGERLVESHLAERFGVSRGPVREALRMLASYGIVRIDPNRGATIPRLSDGEAAVASEVTGLLLAYAAKRAAGGPEDARAAFRDAAGAIVERADHPAATADDYFSAVAHAVEALFACVPSPLLHGMFRNIAYLGPAAPYMRLGVGSRRHRTRRARQWRALGEAVAAGDARRAEREALGIQQASLTAAREIVD